MYASLGVVCLSHIKACTQSHMQVCKHTHTHTHTHSRRTWANIDLLRRVLQRPWHIAVVGPARSATAPCHPPSSCKLQRKKNRKRKIMIQRQAGKKVMTSFLFSIIRTDLFGSNFLFLCHDYILSYWISSMGPLSQFRHRVPCARVFDHARMPARRTAWRCTNLQSSVSSQSCCHGNVGYLGTMTQCARSP